MHFISVLVMKNLIKNSRHFFIISFISSRRDNGPEPNGALLLAGKYLLKGSYNIVLLPLAGISERCL